MPFLPASPNPSCLQAQNAKLRRERDEFESKGKELCQSLGNLMQATRGHSLNTIQVVMGDLPPPERFDGHKLTVAVVEYDLQQLKETP
jgi:hypothetical protein